MTSCLLVSAHVITEFSVERFFKKIKTFGYKYLYSQCNFYPTIWTTRTRTLQGYVKIILSAPKQDA